jgi:NAD(P)-dependent dehydrogenase (short-subunit alcohol dehydrogenase family)
MRDKVCLITGATSGIGLATALGLAQQGASVILVGRNQDRGTAALARIRDETGNRSACFLAADLSAHSEVRQLAQEVQARYPRLDVLINNAGSFFHRRQESADGIEMTWALNVLGPFLLTKLLSQRLKASAPARVLNVSSVMQRVGRMHFGDLEGKQRYNRVRAYSQSKLALVLLAYEFARRLGGTGVTVNALNPGFVATGIISGNGGWPWGLFQAVANLVAVSPQAGAQTGIYLASSPDVAATTGQYFKGGKAVPSSAASYDLAAAQRLWQVCLEMTGEAASLA